MKKIRTIALVLACLMLLSAVAILSASAETIYFKPEQKGSMIYGIPAETNVSTFKKAYPKTIIEVTDINGAAVPNSAKAYIGTGYNIKLVTVNYTAVVLGDLNGNGTIDANDYMLVKRAYLGTYKATDLELRAAGVAENGTLKASHYMKIKRACLGTYDINSKYTVPEGYDPNADESGWTGPWV